MTVSRHAFTLAAVDGTTSGTPLKPISASLTLNERYSPYCRASFEVAMPDAETLEDLLSPRGGQVQGSMLVDYRDPITAAEVTALAGGTPVSAADITAILGPFGPPSIITNLLSVTWNTTEHPRAFRPFTLRVDSVRPDYARGTAQIEASSFESRLQDYRYSGSSGFLIAPDQSLRWIIQAVLNTVNPTFVLDPGGAPDGVVVGPTIWEFGVSAWDFLDSLMQPSGRTLQCWEDGTWHLIWANAEPTTTVTLDRITSLDPVDDRDEWADFVIVRYKWRDGYGVDQIMTDYATTGGGTWQKMLVVEHSTPYPGPGAAAVILARANRLGRDIGVSAVSHYSLTPGQRLEVDVPDVDLEASRITAVTFEWPDNTMRLATQQI